MTDDKKNVLRSQEEPKAQTSCSVCGAERFNLIKLKPSKMHPALKDGGKVCSTCYERIWGGQDRW